MGITVDISGALKKNEMLRNIPAATKKQLTRFATDIIQPLRDSAAKLKRVDKYRKSSGALFRSPGYKVGMTGNQYYAMIGTGVGSGSKMAEKYARIQDTGGITRPTVTPRMRKWAWYMFYKFKEDKFKGIALTKKQKLLVRIPASHWFTSVWERWLPLLKTTYLNEKVIQDTAQRMSGGGTNAS